MLRDQDRDQTIIFETTIIRDRDQDHRNNQFFTHFYESDGVILGNVLTNHNPLFAKLFEASIKELKEKTDVVQSKNPTAALFI